MTPEEYRSYLAKRTPVEKRPKYGNKKKSVNGVEFDSTKEARRYVDLLAWQQSGQIRGLEHQKAFPIVVENVHICEYQADFVYFTGEQMVVEDVKSKITRKNPVYRLKKRLFEAIYKIEIQEV